MKKILFLLLSVFLVQSVYAQCPALVARKTMASSFHSSVLITYDSVVRYWGDEADIDGVDDILTPVTLAKSNYGGASAVALSVAGGSTGAGTHQLYVHSTVGIYGWGVSANTIVSGTSGQVGITNIALPGGVSISDVSFIEAAAGGLCLVTNAGALYVRKGNGAGGPGQIYGDGSTTLDGAGSTVWHQVLTAVATPLTNVIRVSMSGRGMMALTSGGNIYVWGNAVFLADGTAASTFAFATLMTNPSGVTATDVNISSHNSGENAAQYILGNDAKMYAVGENNSGNLGQGTTTDATSWVAVKGPGGTGTLDNVVLIGSNNAWQGVTTFAYSVGALTSSGNLYLWGNNNSDMVGGDTLSSLTTPPLLDSAQYTVPRIPPNFSYNHSAIGYFEMGGHTTAAFQAGTSKFCYIGHKIRGSMGDGSGATGTRKSFDCINTPEEYVCPPSPAVGCPLPTASEIFASSVHASLVLNGTPSVTFWGEASSSAEPGINVTAPLTLFEYNGAPKGVAASGVASSPSALATQMWLHTTAGIWGWGYSANTILSNRAAVSPIAELPLPGGVSAAQISFIRSSRGGIALVTTTGEVWVRAGAASSCSPRIYGDGSASLDAAGSTTWHQVTTAVATPLTGVVELSFGGTAAIAITATQAYVWGDNTFLGNGTAAANRNRAALMTLAAGVRPRTAEIIQSGSLEAAQFILGKNNKVYCLGRNANGVLGIGSATTTLINTNWDSLALVGIRKISSNNPFANGVYSMGAITLLGNVTLWGANDNNRLGFTSTANVTSPTAATTVPAGDAANFEIAGEHTIIFSKSSAQFYFAGQTVGGSRADGSADGITTNFTLAGTVINCANTAFNLSGNLYQDNNGLTDNLVNGTAISSVGGVAMHANLLDEGGYVIATTPIVGGAYSFTSIPFGNYFIQVSPTAGTIFALAPTSIISGGYVYGGEQIGTVAGVNVDATPDGKIAVALSETKTNVNFGITPPPPVANNIAAPRMNNSVGITAIPQLQASSPINTTIDSFFVATIPAPASGVLYYCVTPGVGCATSPVTAGMRLTYNQSKSLFFDPAATFTGTASFTYNVHDNNSLASNTATYTIPVYNNPPVTQNVTAAQMANTNAATLIPGLIGADADGTVSSYTVSSIPSASQGVLTYCTTGDEPCTGVVTTISGTTVLTPAQMGTLKLDPDPGFTGNYVFDYIATDNNSNTSNTSTYTVPVVAPLLLGSNLPPVATNIISQNINNSLGATPIPNLLGTDPDGTVVSYTIGASVPNTVTQGTLSYCTTPPSTGCGTPVTASLVMTPAQAATLSFDPVSSFIGTASFTYTATDNYGTPLTSAPATYQIPVVNTPPVANPDKVAPIANTLVTPTLLPPLSGSDYDGTVVSYNITSVPAASQGTLQYCVSPGVGCALTTIAAPISGLTPAQIATMNFTPVSTFTGNYVFNFTTVDNNSLVSQPATFTIPVVAAPITTGQPPIAYSYNNAPISSLSTAALTTALTGTDPDGTIASYQVRSITPANEGTLTYCTTPPSTGCGTAVSVGMSLTPAQAATVLFTPNANFTGTSTFTYSNTDNSDNLSNIATITIPVVNNPPVARNISNAPIEKTASATTLNPLASTDADGTVVNYTILTIPTVSQGTLRVCTSAPSTGCTPVTAGQVLTPAQISQLAFTPNPAATSPLVTFLYSTIDNSGNTGNIASASLSLFDPLIIPPVANNISAPPMNNNVGRTSIPQLQASSPADVAITSFSVLTLPPASEGVLYYCATAPAVCALGSLTAVSTSTPLTPAQSESLYFDPAATFTGNSTFTYNATDANGLLSNTATYAIPVINNPPVTINVRTAQLIDTTDRIYLPELVGADKDGTVVSYTVSSIPGAGAVLTYCSTGDVPCTGVITTITGTTVLTPAQAITLEIDSTTGFSGDYIFNYIATDNNGNVSNTSTYTIPIVPFTSLGGNMPPVATNITTQNINSSAAATRIPNLLGTDPDGNVASYTIGATVPNTVTQGTLSYCTTPPATGCGTPVTASLVLTPAQAATLSFDPVATFTGIASFTYTATDDNGTPLTSAPATYQIPIVNNPPVANPDKVAPIANTVVTPTLLPPLSGSDYDGTVVSYNITTVPPSTQGTLQYCATPGPGCVLSTIAAPITGLTPAQVATLNFIPNSGFTGNYIFNFTTVDNNSLVSQPAPFTVPVVAFDVTPGEPPIAYSYNNAPISSLGTAALTSALTGTDPDGTIASYTVTSITPANEGTLTYCTTPPSTGCGTAVTVSLVLTPAQAATILFTPNANFTGTSTFNYTNIDNDGNLSNTATVTIPVVNNPPVSTNINNAAMSRVAPATSLLPLSSTDGDGTVVSYTILTVPTIEEGVLRVCTTAPSTGCTPVTAGQVLTPAQISQLAFTPEYWNHSPVITFLYSTIDNSGNLSNIAAANIPMFDVLPLPIELLDFTAKKQGKNALIEWETGIEKAGVKYYLQHSVNGKDWSVINTQNAKSQGSISNKYDFVHTNISNGTQYYRLKIMDMEGNFKYSLVRTLNFDQNQNYSIIVHPNPVTDNVVISTSDGTPMSQISIYNNEGKKIQEFTQVNSGTSINMNAYTSGLYLIKIQDKNGEMQVMKITKK